MKCFLLVFGFNKSNGKKQQKYFKSFFKIIFTFGKTEQDIPRVQNISFYKHFQASIPVNFDKIKPRAQIDRISVFNALCKLTQAVPLKIRAVPICGHGFSCILLLIFKTSLLPSQLPCQFRQLQGYRPQCIKKCGRVCRFFQSKCGQIL